MTYSPYSTQSISGFNTSPPPNDGSTGASNVSNWDTQVLGKVGTPVKNYADAIQDAVEAAWAARLFGSRSAQSTTYTIQTTDAGKVIACTGTFTVTMPAAATVDSTWAVVVQNAGVGVITLDGDGTETINGALTLTVTGYLTTYLLISDGSNWNAYPLHTGLPAAHIQGMVPSRDAGQPTKDINITAGQVRDASSNGDIVLATEITKQLDNAWAVGDDAGGLDTGAIAADNVYNVWAIKRTDTGVVDALLSLSATSPTMPTDYDLKRRVGAVRTDSSSNILAFEANEIANGALDVTLDATIKAQLTVNASLSTVNMSAINSICLVKFYINILNVSAVIFRVHALTQDDVTPATGDSNMVAGAGTSVADEFHIMTNASSQVGMRGHIASTTVDHGTFGWVDFRLP